MSRGEDSEKNKLLTHTLVSFNEILLKAGDGKFLMGTAHPTLMDSMYAPFLEIFNDWQYSVMSNVLDDAEFTKHGKRIGE